MARIPAVPLSIVLFFLGLVLYGVLVWLSGPDPHVPRNLTIDLLGVLSGWVMVSGVVIASKRAFDSILESEPDLPWHVPAEPRRRDDLPEAA